MKNYKQKIAELLEIVESGSLEDIWLTLAWFELDQWKQRILEFAKESNRIEGITNDPKADEDHAERLSVFLELDEIKTADVCIFNTAGRLRITSSDNVHVGDHVPPKGGQHIIYKLDNLVQDLKDYTPFYNHQMFETLHPFTDGNGRTGRAIWLWQMVNKERYNIDLGFLHMWYYQSLQEVRS